MMFFAPYTLSFGRDLPHSSSSGNDYVLVSKELRGTDRRRGKRAYITIINLLILTDTAKFDTVYLIDMRVSRLDTSLHF